MNPNSPNLEINKKPHSKKLPWVKLFLASVCLLALVIVSKNLFDNTSATSAAALRPGISFTVLGDQATQKQAQSTATALASTAAITAPVVVKPTLLRAQDSTSTEQNITIKNTPTGYLNVRSQPSLSGFITGKVYPGETNVYTATKNGWYRIILKSKKYGWVDGMYVIRTNK